ncbi:PAS domain S-box protein [Reyranella sp.]|uniref:sensor histidine kinase n=1 Tax=Reyranella sp. TaxID=1929291 RepID=UPI002F95D2F6
MTTRDGMTDEARRGASPQGYVRLNAERLLDMLPVAGYICNEDGLLVRYNDAAVRLWGRAPGLLDPKQRFCGSYRLYLPDGTPLEHADCPMATSLQTGDPVCNGRVVIERPDGTRALALANIEVLKDEVGKIVGAINWLRELSEGAPAAANEDVVVLTFERRVRENAAARPPRDGGEDLQQQSIRYFQELLLALPAAIYTTDAEGRITFYNDAAVDLWGCRPELGKSEFCGSWKLYWPDGMPLPHDECPMAKALREKRPNRGMEAIAERPDGSRIPFMPYPSPIFDSEGRLIGAVNMLVDLSALKRGEEMGARLAAIVESSADAIVGKTLEGRITSWNRGAEQLFGYSANEAIGRSIMMLIPHDRTGEEASIIDRIRRGLRVETYETIRRRKDGSLVAVSLTVSPIRDGVGRVIGASKIARDISERKRIEEQSELLMREMNHRIKNLFALASGLVGASKDSARTPGELAKAVQGRLLALAHAHDLTLPVLPQREGMEARATSLKDLLAAIAAPYNDPATQALRVVLDAPEMAVAGQAATNLALLLHELTTNAAKYGALSSPSGHVQLTGSDEGDRFLLVWREHGGPALAGAPPALGFGSILTQQIVGQFGGEISYRWDREGLVVQLTLRRDRLSR